MKSFAENSSKFNNLQTLNITNNKITNAGKLCILWQLGVRTNYLLSVLFLLETFLCIFLIKNELIGILSSSVMELRVKPSSDFM